MAIETMGCHNTHTNNNKAVNEEVSHLRKLSNQEGVHKGVAGLKRHGSPTGPGGFFFFGGKGGKCFMHRNAERRRVRDQGMPLGLFARWT